MVNFLLRLADVLPKQLSRNRSSSLNFKIVFVTKHAGQYGGMGEFRECRSMFDNKARSLTLFNNHLVNLNVKLPGLIELEQ